MIVIKATLKNDQEIFVVFDNIISFGENEDGTWIRDVEGGTIFVKETASELLVRLREEEIK